MKYRPLPYRILRFSYLSLIILSILGPIYWLLDNPDQIQDEVYWMAELNTLTCSRMSEALPGWLGLQEKQGNACQIYTLGANKFALICLKSQYVIGTSKLECLEAGVGWNNGKTKV